MHRRSSTAAFLLVLAVATGWSIVFVIEALQRWRFERICAMACGPFWEVGTVELIRHAMDWQTPLALAALPLALWGAMSLWRRCKGLMRHALDPS